MRKVLIFGGTGAIGSETARLFQKNDSKVAFTYFSRLSEAEKLAKELSATAVVCDLRSRTATAAAVDKAVSSLGGLDVVVIAIGSRGEDVFYRKDRTDNYDHIQEIPEEKFENVMDLNARGVFFACQSVIPHMKNGGSIAILGTLNGLKALPSPIHMAMAKSSLRGLVEALSKEVGPQGIRVNLIAPGMLDTGSSQAIAAPLKQEFLKYCALERFGKVSDAAEAVYWVSCENTFMTGQMLPLDGGL